MSGAAPVPGERRASRGREARVLSYQKRYRRVIRMRRIGLACVGCANCGLLTDVLMAEKVTRLNTLVAPRRHSKLVLPRNRKTRERLASRPNCAGPRIEFRPASPHVPGAGVAYAAGFAYAPPGAGSTGVPVNCGRIPTNPVPLTVRNDTGVNGSPLPV